MGKGMVAGGIVAHARDGSKPGISGTQFGEGVPVDEAAPAAREKTIRPFILFTGP